MDNSEKEVTSGRDFVRQLDVIFRNDPLMEASRSSVSEASGDQDSVNGAVTLEQEALHTHADCSRKTEHRVDQVARFEGTSYEWEGVESRVPYDGTAFWSGQHKLAISMLALAPLYKAAKETFSLLAAEYRKFRRRSFSKGSGSPHAGTQVKERTNLSTSDEECLLEIDLMNSTRALVLVNCDHATAWNTRKRLLALASSPEDILMSELRLAGIVLSCSPKSEETWAHRRWVILQLSKTCVSRVKMDGILEGESKLVETIAERSPMNYRAWRHRCWLVAHMSILQIAIELHRTKLWASRHIGDNCCFHYRRSLLSQFLGSKTPRTSESKQHVLTADKKELEMKSLKVALLDVHETRSLWKEEVNWTKELIQRYLGREALWIHLRFLLQSWVLNAEPALLCGTRALVDSVPRKTQDDFAPKEMFLSLDSEKRFVSDCIQACSNILSEDGIRQRELAAAYQLWVFITLSRQGKDVLRREEWNIMERFLMDEAPHRKGLWSGLVPIKTIL